MAAEFEPLACLVAEPRNAAATPRARRRQVGLFVLLGMGMLLATLLWLAGLLNWPAPLKATSLLLLVLLTLYWLAVVAFTAVLKVGNDGWVVFLFWGGEDLCRMGGLASCGHMTCCAVLCILDREYMRTPEWRTRLHLAPVRCTNLEAQVVSRLADSDIGDKEKLLMVAWYYLYNEGGSVEQVGSCCRWADEWVSE